MTIIRTERMECDHCGEEIQLTPGFVSEDDYFTVSRTCCGHGFWPPSAGHDFTYHFCSLDCMGFWMVGYQARREAKRKEDEARAKASAEVMIHLGNVPPGACGAVLSASGGFVDPDFKES